MKIETNEIKISSFWFFFTLSLIIVWGIFIRLWNLDSNPVGIYNDEARQISAIISTAENNNYKLFFENSGESLHSNLLAISFKFFGSEIFYFRLISALIGIFSFLGFYLLLKELRFSKLSVLIGTFIFASSFWHLNFSRTIHSEILIPFIIIWFLYFILRAFREKSLKNFIFASLIIGVGFYSHPYFKIIPIVILFSVFACYFKKRISFEENKRNLGIVLIVSFLIMTPLIMFFISNPDKVIGQNNFFLLNQKYEKSSIALVSENLLNEIGAFYFSGDYNQRHSQADSPLIPASWALLLAIGFTLSIKDLIYYKTHFKERKLSDPLFKISLISQVVFWFFIIPGILTFEETPNILLTIGILPAIAMFVIIPFEYILRLKENLQKSETIRLKPLRKRVLDFSLSFLVLIVVLSGLAEVYTYHFVWNKEIKTLEAFDVKFFDLGKLLKNNLRGNNILIVPKNIALNSVNNSLAITKISGYPEIKEFKIVHPDNPLLSEIKSCKNNNFIFLEPNQSVINELLLSCQNFVKLKDKNLDGYYEFLILRN